jgi:predicted secreted protein
MAIRSQGTLFQYGDGTGSPGTYQTVGEVVSISGPGGEASEIDVTHLGSTAKSYLIGLPDEGDVTLSVNHDNDDTTQQALRTARTNATLTYFKIVLSDTKTITFVGFVKGYSVTIDSDSKVMADITIRVSGAVTYNT